MKLTPGVCFGFGRRKFKGEIPDHVVAKMTDKQKEAVARACAKADKKSKAKAKADAKPIEDLKPPQEKEK